MCAAGSFFAAMVGKGVFNQLAAGGTLSCHALVHAIACCKKTDAHVATPEIRSSKFSEACFLINDLKWDTRMILACPP